MKKYYKPKKIISIPTGGTYTLSKVEYLIVEKEYNISWDLLPKYDKIGKERYIPCVRRVYDLKIIENRKNKIKRLENILEKIRRKIKRIMEIFPIETWNIEGNFEIDRLHYYLRTREIGAEMLLESLYNSIK